jgi:hypothetical protein
MGTGALTLDFVQSTHTYFNLQLLLMVSTLLQETTYISYPFWIRDTQSVVLDLEHLLEMQPALVLPPEL